MQEKENILRILEETKKAVIENNSIRLRELSDQTVHTSSITQDEDNIAVAVMVYSLGKIIERREYQNFPEWHKFYKLIMSSLDNLSLAVKEDNQQKTTKYLTVLRKSIERLSGKFKIYIQDVFRKAQINKASKIYEHGISMGKTAKLLGITLFELVSYAGQKPEVQNLPLGHTIDVKSRIKLTEDFFNDY